MAEAQLVFLVVMLVIGVLAFAALPFVVRAKGKHARWRPTLHGRGLHRPHRGMREPDAPLPSRAPRE